LQIVRVAVEKHPENIEDAIKQAEHDIRKLPSFAKLVSDLVRSAIGDLVYDARHQITTSIKQAACEYGGPAKVVVGASKSVNTAALSVYLFCIAGTTLGNLRGEQLAGIIESERAIRDGHDFNVRLCERLLTLVPKKKRVRDVVSEKKLRGIFQQIEEENKAA